MPETFDAREAEAQASREHEETLWHRGRARMAEAGLDDPELFEEDSWK